jgi:hypothetical protein
MDTSILKTNINNIYAEICYITEQSRIAVENYNIHKTLRCFLEIQRLTAISSTLWNRYQNTREKLYDEQCNAN